MIHAIRCPEHAQQVSQAAILGIPLLGIRKDIRKKLFRCCIVLPVKRASCVLISRQPQSLAMALKKCPASPARRNNEDSQKDPSAEQTSSPFTGRCRDNEMRIF